ncbi:MAG TPA: POTRA domain-containing protein, partial [Thermoanaerobaculia bacterium]|nr:POTRA domain-containing protein [Thermoanaerobaculia bacterium]
MSAWRGGPLARGLLAVALLTLGGPLLAQEPAPPEELDVAPPREVPRDELDPPGETEVDEEGTAAGQRDRRVPLPGPQEVLPPAGDPPMPLLPGGAPGTAPPPEIPASARRGPPPRVAAIEIRSDAQLTEVELERLGELLGFATGEPLTEAAVARTLRNLQASGIASRVAVLTRPAAAGDGVVAVLALWANVVVTEIRIAGETGSVSSDRLREVIPQRVGEPLVEAKLVQAVFDMQDRLERSGHFDATVRLEPEIDMVRQRAVIVYRIEAGPRATIADVGFRGPTAPFTPAELLEPIRGKPGEPYRRSLVLEDAERLESWLIGEGHRTARVD